jgi:glycosyltransferase involved in cell wall biosynthesis
MPTTVSTTSVVISTYDEKRWEDLVACVSSLRSQDHGPLETIVVVDHNPALLDRAEAAFPEARIVPNERPRGLAGARNSGTAIAGGEIVAFIDDDAAAEADWVRQIEACFGAAETVGVGGALLPAWPGAAPTWFPAEFLWVVGCSYKGLPEELGPVRNPIGANMAVRKAVLEEVGGFREGVDEDAPRQLRARGVVRAGGNVPDDTDLAIRVKELRTDAVWLYQPAARVHHTVTPERTSLGYFLRRSYEEGIGKASLAGLVGAENGLSSERRHLAAVLPAGIARGLRDTLGGDRGGLLRALAIIAGTAAAALGYTSVKAGRSARAAASRIRSA